MSGPHRASEVTPEYLLEQLKPAYECMMALSEAHVDTNVALQDQIDASTRDELAELGVAWDDRRHVAIGIAWAIQICMEGGGQLLSLVQLHRIVTLTERLK